MYDLVVIGGGTAGLVTAAGSAGLGARVALVERERLGGECLWTGCVPSKALLAAAGSVHAARVAGRFGVDAGDPRVDWQRVTQWVRDAQARIAPHDSPERFRDLGVDVIEGEARFTGERTIVVGARTLTAKRIVIATGSRPSIPAVDGLDRVPYHTHETIFSLEQQPETLLVLGGGPIGVELAQAFARLGSRVHLVESGPTLLSHEDEEVSALLTTSLADEGVQVHTNVTVERAEHVAGTSRIRLRFGTSGAGGNDGRERGHIEGDVLLVATGRTPRVDTLDLARGGVEATPAGITVDAGLQTTADGVWAAGDCVGPLRFTHIADYQARLVIRNAFFPFTSKANYDAVPWVTFTDPELARVGLTEREARERHGDNVRVWRRPFAEVDRAITDGNTRGLVKLVTDSRGKVLGGHILGHGAGNAIGEITLAMKHGISAQALGNTIHPYPTYPEAIRHAAEQYTKSRFTGVVKSIATWLVRR